MIYSEVYKINYDTLQTMMKNYSSLVSSMDYPEFLRWSTAVAYVESKFNPNAKNPNSTAKGLFQVLQATQKWVESSILRKNNEHNDKLYVPEYASLIGIGYLSYLYQKYKDIRKAIIAYNQGHYNESKAGTNYYSKVKAAYDKFNDVAEVRDSQNDDNLIIVTSKRGFK